MQSKIIGGQNKCTIKSLLGISKPKHPCLAFLLFIAIYFFQFGKFGF